MTIFRILTALFLSGVTFFCCAAESDVPTGYVKIGPEHAIPSAGGRYGRVEYEHPDYEITAPAEGGPRLEKSDDDRHEIMMKRKQRPTINDPQ